MNQDEEARLELIAAELVKVNARGPIRLEMNGQDAFALVALLQLAWRHPGLSQKQRRMIQAIVRSVQELVGDAPELERIILDGWSQ